MDDSARARNMSNARSGGFDIGSQEPMLDVDLRSVIQRGRLQHVGRDQMPKLRDIYLAFELESDLSKAAEPQI